MDFILGGVAGGAAVCAWLLALAVSDWFDMRGARRLQRAAKTRR